MGVVVGALAGLIGGLLVMYFPPQGMVVQWVMMLIGGIAGVLLGL